MVYKTNQLSLQSSMKLTPSVGQVAKRPVLTRNTEQSNVLRVTGQGLGELTQDSSGPQQGSKDTGYRAEIRNQRRAVPSARPQALQGLSTWQC